MSSLLIIIWLVVWNIFLFFHIIYGNNHPNWLSYFSEGVETTNHYIYICNYIELSISSFELSHHPTWNSVDHLPGRQVLPVAMAVFLAPCEAWNIRKIPNSQGQKMGKWWRNIGRWWEHVGKNMATSLVFRVHLIVQWKTLIVKKTRFQIWLNPLLKSV